MNGKGWFWELVIVLAIIAAVVVAVIVLSCCVCRGDGVSPGRYHVAPWAWVLVQFALSGALGGILAVLRLFDLEVMYKSGEWTWNRAKFQNLMVALGISAMGGVGGAGAALYLLILNEKMQDVSLEGLDILRNCTMGLIAGFIGFSLLRKAGDSLNKMLENKLNTLEADTTRQEMELACNRGLYAFRENKPNSLAFKDAQAQLERMRKIFPEHRMAAIVLANLYYLKEEYEKSIEIVTETIDEIARRETSDNKELSRENRGDLLYNRACYAAKIHVKSQDQRKKDEYKRKMLDDLRNCFELTPSNVHEATTDGDFKVFRADAAANQPGDPDFLALIQEFQARRR